MTSEVRTVQAGEVIRYADGIREVYASAFAAPPWNADPAEADVYVERLARDALRPGFTAAVATTGGTVTVSPRPGSPRRSFRPSGAMGRSPKRSVLSVRGRGSAGRWR
ncbi:hypothetical protein GCM10010231_63370 [Streptomyces sindenensis]|nr:hypothetical protein GCM10010231_63370 [Streptomyces sindenensis]